MARILIVDDEPGIRLTLQEFLRDEGFEVETAQDSFEALALLDRHRFDVVVTDVILPRQSGVELMHAIRERDPEIPIILITGEPTVDSAVEAVRAGAFNYLPKPVGGDAICTTVANAAKVRQLQEDNHQLWLELSEHREHLEDLVQERTQALEESEARYRRLTENAVDMIWRISFEGTVLFVNNAVEKQLGWSVERALGREMEEYLTEPSIERIRQSLREAFHRNESSIQLEVDFRHVDGTPTPCEATISFIRGESGRVEAFEGISRDISHRRDMEARLRDREEMFRSITEEAYFGILIIQDEKIRYANHICPKFLGYTIDEMTAFLPGEAIKMLHPEDISVMLEQHRRKLNQESGFLESYVFRAIHRDGHPVYLRLCSKRIDYRGRSAILVNLIPADEQAWSKQGFLKRSDG